MANDIFGCDGNPSGNQSCGSAVVMVKGVKSGGTHYKALTTRNFTVNLATYADAWIDRFDDPRYYTGDTSA